MYIVYIVYIKVVLGLPTTESKMKHPQQSVDDNTRRNIVCNEKGGFTMCSLVYLVPFNTEPTHEYIDGGTSDFNIAFYWLYQLRAFLERVYTVNSNVKYLCYK